MAIFRPKPWKMSIFGLFVVIFFTAWKGVFSFYNMVRDIFLCYIAEKKKNWKKATFGPKAWLNPFGKMSFF